VNPVASPVALAQDASPAQDSSVDSRGTSEKTAIQANGTWGQKQGYQGTVYLDRDSGPEAKNEADEAMSGVKVFLQYVNGKGQVSPIYYTTSDSEGKFVFDLSKPPKDALGNPVKFQLAGDEKFQVRTWAENPNPAKYTLAAGGDMYSGRFHNRTTRKWETWDFTAGINRIVDAKVVFQERPNLDGWLAKPEAEWTEAPTADKKWPEGGDYGTARGNVWWENNEAEGSLSNQYYKGPSDRAATDVKVVGSYVNDEVARKFDAWKAANKNYTREQFRVAQKEIVDKYQAEHGAGSHIAESRVAYLKDNGSFYLPFAGLYGIDRNKKGSKTTDEEWGTLVSKKDEEHGNLMQWNGTLGQRHRHINSDYMYLYPVVGDNRDLWMGNYQDNMFQPPHGGNLGIELESANIVFQNFALLTPRPLHDVYNFDNTSSLAAPGDTAKSKTTGLVPNQTYAIEWFADGQSTGKTCTVKANEKGELESCDLTVPKNLSKPTVYSSQVFAADASGKPTGTLLLADSFLADPTVVRYDDTKGTAKEKDLEAKPSFDNPNSDVVEKMPEGATFEFSDPAAAKKLGLSIDPKTGAVKWPADKQVEGENEVLVKVTWKPAAGADPVSREVPAKFNLSAPVVKDNESFAPEYKDGSGKPGEDVTVPAPKFTDKDVKDTKAPEGTKFAPGDNAPAGVKVDPETGEIKVTVPADAKPGDKITVPVVVTYPDGSKDTVDVTVTVDKPDVPAPSITAGSETDEVPADGSEKTLDDKVENPTDGMTGEVLDKDGNPIKDATVTVDPETGEIKVTVPEGTAAQDGKVVVKDKDGKEVGTVDVKITEPKTDVPAPSITAGSETDEVPADGSEKTLDDKVENPTDGMTGEVLDKDGNPIKDATVTVDPETGEIKVTVPEGTAAQDGKVVVKDKDGKEVGTVDVKITEPKTDVPDTSNASVVPDAVTVVEGQEAKPFEVAKNIPEGGKVVVDGLPDGLSVDESTGEVTGTPAKISDWGKDEEERDVEVTVSVTDKDGKEVAQGTKTVTVQRDTDGDGQPDVTDTDDDNDGATDAEEAAAGTDPKDASSKPAPTDESSVVPDTVTVVEGQEAKPFEVAKNIPEGGKVVVDGLPDGLSVDESTGEVTGTPAKISDWGKDEEERDVEVTVSVTDKDGKEVAQGTKTVTVQRDTDGDGQPDVTDTDDDNDGATDAEEAAAGTDPKDASSKPEAKPGDDQGATSVDKSGVKDVKPSGEDQDTGIKVINPDEGTKVSATDKNGKDVPAKIDDNGNVVVTPGKDVEGPITVVIEDEDLDGGKTEVEVGVKDEEPGNQDGSSNVPGGSSLPGLSSGSSNVDWERCAPAAAGVGLPLLFLLPIGLASQMNIPGFSPLVKQVSAQIDGINRQLGQQNVALQKQLGIYNGPLAKQASQIDMMLKKVSPEAGRIGGGVVLAAAGALALGLLINSCAPGAGSSSSSK